MTLTINNSEEIWKELKDFNLPYMINNKGNFKRLPYIKTDLCNRTYTKPERILYPTLSSKGYYLYSLADEAAKSVGCSSVFIHRCCNISTRTAKGFHWSYSPIKLKMKKYD